MTDNTRKCSSCQRLKTRKFIVTSGANGTWRDETGRAWTGFKCAECVELYRIAKEKKRKELPIGRFAHMNPNRKVTAE